MVLLCPLKEGLTLTIKDYCYLFMMLFKVSVQMKGLRFVHYLYVQIYLSWVFLCLLESAPQWAPTWVTFAISSEICKFLSTVHTTWFTIMCNPESYSRIQSNMETDPLLSFNRCHEASWTVAPLLQIVSRKWR